jgi:transcriptional regulator GlxA family with amidase domain
VSYALSLVEEDLGHDIAIRVASQLVMFFKRPGGQVQFSRQGAAAPVGRAALQDLQRWVAAHPDADVLRRAFMRQVGVTPAEYRKRFAATQG